MNTTQTDYQWLRELFEFENCSECGQDETGHIVSPDALGLRHAWCQHYHVQRHDEYDDIYTTWDLGDAMYYASTELDQLTDSEHSMIGVYGEAGDYEGAYRAWERCEAWSVVALNAHNIYRQYSPNPADRAPLYRADDSNTLALRRVHAEHVMEDINRKGPNGFAMWACTSNECAPSEDDGDE